MNAPLVPTPLRAIRLKCLDCCSGSKYEVRVCGEKDIEAGEPYPPQEDLCPLHPFRFGRNPNREGVGNHAAKPPKWMPKRPVSSGSGNWHPALVLDRGGQAESWLSEILRRLGLKGEE